ncbi:hypothetical protein BD779DRAFT_1802787 [Infundibulicybe gibba]|nr:hypothetical protein BD779DRAFT_1802787 [Infundibulicybe gibba]
MRDLPPEIIEIIFLRFCSSKTIFPLQRDEPRLLITQVCSQWRAVALAIPSLWANIRISLDSTPLFDPVHVWISRSAQYPLSFGIRGPRVYGAFSTITIDLIFPIIQHCTFLKLYINEIALTRLLTPPAGSFCALQRISIKSVPTPYVMSRGMIPRATAFQQCPQLRQMTFGFAAHAVDPADFNLPWHQLTHLDAHSCSFREYECLDVLRQCTALEECSISTFPIHSRDLQKTKALSRRPIVLPSLHTLRLDLGDPAVHSVHFVHALRLPRLCSLHATSSKSQYYTLLPVFQTLLSETICHLDLSGWNPMDIPGALALVPNLEALKLWGGDPEVLQALGRGAIPHLVALRLGVVDPCDLFDILEARVAAARCDSSIAVISDVSAVDSGVGDIMMDTTRLEALRANGVQVVFRNWS